MFWAVNEVLSIIVATVDPPRFIPSANTTSSVVFVCVFVCTRHSSFWNCEWIVVMNSFGRGKKVR